MLLEPTCSIHFRGRSCLGLLSPLLGLARESHSPTRRSLEIMCTIPFSLVPQRLRSDGVVPRVTIIATSVRILRPNPSALAAKGRRWSSLNRMRRPPRCSDKHPVLLTKVIDD